ncbi:MAG: hypothetical protein ABSC05_39175 [Candidatus Solibacter sp.]|jgi:hypothetical protein
MGTDNINAEIAGRIMGWEIADRELGLYRDPKHEKNVVRKLPDFVCLQRAHGLLRQTLQNRCEKLAVTENPTDPEKGVGRTFTASLSRQNNTFQATQSDERLAVCVAALEAYGLPTSNL